jgi:hypothetical protein
MKIKSTQQQVIARQLGITGVKYSRIKTGFAFTDNKVIAEHFADKFGKAPIDYIKENLRSVYGKLWPSIRKERTPHA